MSAPETDPMSAAGIPSGDGGAGDYHGVEAFERLNERFYNSCPSKYFEHRLNNLLVAAAADEKLGPRLRAGINICGDRIEIGDDERIESVLPVDTLGRFVTAESVVLLSHVAESTMRLFLAHEGHPPCPWFSISSLGFGDFWREVELRFVKPVQEARLRAVVADVTLGAPERYDQFPADQAGWDLALDRLTMWLRHLAEWLIDNKHPYNAAKHGFTAMADQAYLNVIDDESGAAFLTHSGPSLEYLSHGPWESGERTWSLTTRWFDPIELWFTIGVSCDLLDAIWSVGRARFLGGSEINVCQPKYTPTELRAACVHRSIDKFSIPLLKEHKLKPPPLAR